MGELRSAGEAPLARGSEFDANLMRQLLCGSR